MKDEFDRLIAEIVRQFFDKVRRALTVACFINVLCYIAAAMLILLLAGYLLSIGDEMPALYVAAFLIAWIGLLLFISGREKIASTEPVRSREVLRCSSTTSPRATCRVQIRPAKLR
jgi:hypothetical protein